MDKVRNKRGIDTGRRAKARPWRKSWESRHSAAAILLKAGLLNKDQMAEVVKQQRRQPSKPIKNIVSSLGFASTAAVERILEESKAREAKEEREHLLDVGLITRSQLNMALDEQRNAPTKRLGSILVEMGFATEEEFDRALTRSPLNTRIPIVLGFGALLVVLSALMVMPSSTDNIRSEIERLDNEIRQNPRDKALVQANLSQIGDIFLENLKEYHQAKAIYEEILRRFPRWEGNDAVYPRLAECYEALSDGEGAQSTYERMIEFFPATSPEYISARAKLDG